MAQDSSSRKLEQYIVRFPDGMRDRIKNEAEMNGRSMNAEIIQRLRDTLDADDVSRLSDRGDYRIVISLPWSIKERVRHAAEENRRDLNSEIAYSLERNYPELPPINDLVYMMNDALARAKRNGDEKSILELTESLTDVYSYFVKETANEQIIPKDRDWTVDSLSSEAKNDGG